MNVKLIVAVIVLVLGAVLVSNAVFTVHETERALLLRFGAVERADIAPGLHIKMPIAEDVRKFDGRVLTLDAPAARYYTLEKKPLVVDMFAKWKVGDVQRYYTASSGDETRARNLLQERVNEGLRNQISRRDMHEVISGERDQLMQELTRDLNEVMSREMGVNVVDVRVKKIDLPPEVSVAVYERMNSEREIEARQYRATGRELALGITADADRQVVVIGAEAYRQAEELRGEGDAKAAEIYAAAFNSDPEFYKFYRSTNAYANVFQDRRDTLVIDPKSDFFQYLEQSGG
ncbi:MAG: protease modulator HflC [Gammaproteobacteria bacterium]|nr:protease modulator HflC [Gammaproteobacteria bacterium]MYB37225.1 protease modulator HflC [Gammaproteobacteria bacterium]